MYVILLFQNCIKITVRPVARIWPGGVQPDALQAKKFFGGFLMIFLNNVWFGFTVVYGCFYYIVNAHYKG